METTQEKLGSLGTNPDRRARIVANFPLRGFPIFFNKNRMLLTLEPDCLTLVGKGGEVVRVEIVAGSGQPWIAAIAAARTLLAEHANGGGRLDVILSENYYRLGLIHADADALEARELEPLARHYFRSVLGEACTACAFRVVRVPCAAAAPVLLACAIESEGIEGLRLAASVARMTLGSLRPRIGILEALLARELESFSGHLVLADRDAAALVALRDGVWTQVMMRRHGDDGAWLGQALEQAENLAATGSRTAWLSGSVSGTEVAGWDVRRAHHLAAGVRQ